MSAQLHLIKLSVGSTSFSELQDWQEKIRNERQHKGQADELMHITRNMPKRAVELLDGGSIYWVIKGVISARQRLLELRPIIHDGVPHCGIVYDPELIRVVPRPRRPFQGWRYLNATDAPVDLARDMSDLPESMLRELAELGVL